MTYNGKKYATLADTPMDGKVYRRQQGFLPLLNFTAISADDADSYFVISSYTWGTDVIVVSAGCEYNLDDYYFSFPKCGYLRILDDMYGVSLDISGEILITCTFLMFEFEMVC